jgi:hypothetical protein
LRLEAKCSTLSDILPNLEYISKLIRIAKLHHPRDLTGKFNNGGETNSFGDRYITHERHVHH